jgi:hypothetical protein
MVVDSPSGHAGSLAHDEVAPDSHAQAAPTAEPQAAARLVADGLGVRRVESTLEERGVSRAQRASRAAVGARRHDENMKFCIQDGLPS